MLVCGKDHAKWQSVQAPGYQIETIIEFDKNKLDDVKKIIAKLPEGIAEIKADKIVLKDEKKLSVLEAYIDKEKIDFIKIKRDPTKVTFSFETDGSLTAKDAIVESAKILEQKYAEFLKQLKSLK